jgi:hypothetical protein
LNDWRDAPFPLPPSHGEAAGAVMDLSHTPVSELAMACRQETEKFRRGEPSVDSFCFELFRRAVCERDQLAWQAVLTQYRGVVLTWVQRQGAAADEVDFWINRAFDRFWSAVGPERFPMFGGLSSVLRYLQMCAASAVLDDARSRRGGLVESLDHGHEVSGTERQSADEGADVEAQAVGRLSGQELWETVTRELADEAERAIVYLSFALDLKPGEIYERRPELFGSVSDVYRIKRNVIDRLRRSQAIRRFWH